MCRGQSALISTVSACFLAAMISGCGGGGSSLGIPDSGGNTGGNNGGGIPGEGSGPNGGSGPGSGSGGGGGTVSPTARAYQGNATVTVSLADASGPEAPQTFSVPVIVAVDVPMTFRGVKEENPFTLSIRPVIPPSQTPHSLPPREDGQFTLLTAHLAKDSEGRATAMRQCWRLESVGGAVNGFLWDNHHLTEEINTINIPSEIAPGTVYPWPSLMQSGARLTGAIHAQQVQLRIEGRANSRRSVHPFTIELTAARRS